MNNKKEELYQSMKEVYDSEKQRISENTRIESMTYLGKAEVFPLIRDEETGEQKKSDEPEEIRIYKIKEVNTKDDGTKTVTTKYFSDEMLLFTETDGVGRGDQGIILSDDYKEKYGDDYSIRDEVLALEQKIEEKGNGQKQEEKDEEELEGTTLEDLEQEKSEEEKEEKEEDEEEEKTEEEPSTEQENKPRKPSGMTLQEIDVDTAKVDEYRTVRQAFGIPSDVKTLRFTYPETHEQRLVSEDVSFDMLDKNGMVIDETSDGKRREDILRVDDATGDNPLNDNSTQLKLNNTARMDSNNTIKRFISPNSPSSMPQTLSIKQKEAGGHVEIYAGGKSRDGNESQEVQLETHVTQIQTDLEPQKVMNQNKGVDRFDDIQDEVKDHQEGDEEVALKNADGNIRTVEECEHIEDEDSIIPGTEMTWKQLSKASGIEDVKEIQKKFYEEFDDDVEPTERVIRIVDDAEEEREAAAEEEKAASKEDDSGKGFFREGLWDSLKH